MNNLEKEVSNLDLSRQLKELGVPQNGYWSWVRSYSDKKFSLIVGEPLGFYRGKVWFGWDKDERVKTPGIIYSAFTTGELGRLLPSYIKTIAGYLELRHSKRNEKSWVVEYINRDDECLKQVSETEADARAKMLVYLLKNGLIKI
jgi:hypothetical protein